MTADEAPDMQGWMLVKDFDKKHWKKEYLRLKAGSLYLCSEENNKVTSLRLCFV